MNAANEINTVFSILHDGTITAWSGDKSLLTLTIECLYLAERMDTSFDRFYVQLANIDNMEFDPWTNPVDIPAIIKTDFADIFKAELEILSAEVKNKLVVVSCMQHDPDFDYSGGNLTISCEAIKVFDQNKREMTIDQLMEICKSYWKEWSRK
ncbi:MAG: hypothetical protein JST26_04615 [Bacteroidetes bacterium]|nr:hypothetical protein [Bacteroidota bacterium]